MSIWVKILVLLTIIFLHIFDDFHLQGILASMKQKQWWKDNSPSETLYLKKYKHDYIVALLAHGFQWGFVTHIPYLVLAYIYRGMPVGTASLILTIAMIVIQGLIHSGIDNDKCNNMQFNLVEDQLTHLAQIIIEWTFAMFGLFNGYNL